MPLKSDDPMQFYTDMRKLGQGASGTVFVGTDVRTGEVRFFFCRDEADTSVFAARGITFCVYYHTYVWVGFWLERPVSAPNFVLGEGGGSHASVGVGFC